MTVSAIVAVSKNGVIGKGNDIPWYLSSDLRYFKRTTINHHIIMGRKTFHSMGRPLPKRTNIVITRNPFFVASNCIITSSLDDALAIAQENGEEEVFIIGGGQIYEMSMPLLDKIYYTEVDTVIEDGEVFFPDFDRNKWTLVSEEPHKADEKNDHDYTFMVFERKVEKEK